MNEISRIINHFRRKPKFKPKRIEEVIYSLGMLKRKNKNNK